MISYLHALQGSMYWSFELLYGYTPYFGAFSINPTVAGLILQLITEIPKHCKMK
jgi:hypothetical protein